MIVGFVTRNLYNMLFLASEKNPPLEEQLYLFMKRFRTQPSEFYGMDRTTRLNLYRREYKVVMEEYKKAKENETS